MGSGKSTVGQHLSRQLGFPFRDLDSEIENSESMTVPDIFKTKGEIYFRKRESIVLTEVLNTDENLVLALGGGTTCYGNVMELLKNQTNCTSIYLKTSLDVLTKRLFVEKSERPLIAHITKEDDLKDFVRKHLFERSYYYNQAHTSIDVSESSVEKTVESIVATLF